MKEKKPNWTWAIPCAYLGICIIVENYILIIPTLFSWIWANVGYDMMKEKGRSAGWGYFLGFVIGLIGLLIIKFIKPNKPHKKVAHNNDNTQ